MTGASDAEERIEDDRTARHEHVEELAEGGQGHLLAGHGVGKPVNEASRDVRADLPELQLMALAPLEEVADAATVGATRVGVPDASGEELVRGKAPQGPGVFQERDKVNVARPAEAPEEYRLVISTSSYGVGVTPPPVVGVGGSAVSWGPLRRQPRASRFPDFRERRDPVVAQDRGGPCTRPSPVS